MTSSTTTCQQTCKGLCTGLEAATATEKKAILMYGTLRDQCTYPDVQNMLTELIEKHRQIILMIENTRRRLHEEFEVLDQVRDSFDVV